MLTITARRCCHNALPTANAKGSQRASRRTRNDLMCGDGWRQKFFVCVSLHNTQTSSVALSLRGKASFRPSLMRGVCALRRRAFAAVMVVVVVVVVVAHRDWRRQHRRRTRVHRAIADRATVVGASGGRNAVVVVVADDGGAGTGNRCGHNTCGGPGWFAFMSDAELRENAASTSRNQLPCSFTCDRCTTISKEKKKIQKNRIFCFSLRARSDGERE